MAKKKIYIISPKLRCLATSNNFTTYSLPAHTWPKGLMGKIVRYENKSFCTSLL